MNKIKIAEAGYTVETESWENDLDNPATNRVVAKTLQEAHAYYFICTKLFCRNEVGNSMANEKYDKVIEFYQTYKNMLDILFDDFQIETNDDIYDAFMDLGSKLMGSSEFYDFRVCASCTVTYLPEDIYAEEVKFI